MGLALVEDLCCDAALESRVAVAHANVVCKGGIFFITAYFWCSEGASARNLALLQAIARIIRQLHGPWILSADFNFRPSTLIKTGWLGLVKGHVVHTGLATCRGVEDDFFVVDQRLRSSVVGIAVVHDTGAKPHSAVRLWLKGRPRSDTANQLMPPPKAPAFLPKGCAVEPSGIDSGLLEQLEVVERDPSMLTRDFLQEAYLGMITSMENQVADVSGLRGKDRDKFICRAQGPKMVLRTALGAPSSAGRKLSPVSVAWATVAGWLQDAVIGFGLRATAQHLAAAKRARWLIHTRKWENLGSSIHANALRLWQQSITPTILDNREQANWCRATASMVAKRTKAYDLKLANAAWESWIADGPAKNLGHQHRFTRVESGWIPSKLRETRDDDDTNLPPELEDEPTEECIKYAETVPISSSEELLEAQQLWGGEWQTHLEQPRLEWPKCIDPRGELPALSHQLAIQTAHTFPTDVGLGWDQLHPRAAIRCSTELILFMVKLLMLMEAFGEWPEAIGITLICLIPKADGGRRPIGLLPTLVRWWMRMRLDIVRAWQAEHARPYFFAGKRKGADVAFWKQSARAEFTSTSIYLAHVDVLLDLIKAFERVSHEWLLRQGRKYSYPLAILRLSIAAYRILRTIVIDGRCTDLMAASRGITAGAVHATIELRLLIIEWADKAVASSPLLTLTVFVDDADIEASGPKNALKDAVVTGTKIFTSGLEGAGMEFSHTKNMCLASDPKLAADVVKALPELGIKRKLAVRSLGGTIGSGVVRSTAQLRSRLEKFKARKPLFQKLRRMRGARCANRVLATGGTAALTFGVSNMGVSNTMLHSQRIAVAAASVPGGAGDLELTLCLADGSSSGHVDPAFEAHEGPIGKWAEAIWESWLPLSLLRRNFHKAVSTLDREKPEWRKVTGPALAFVASAYRLGWHLTSLSEVTTADGTHLAFQRDSPARVKKVTRASVRHWRNRRIAARHPHLDKAGSPGAVFLEPIYRLLKPKDFENWAARERGGLRSAVLDRQWTQQRLHAAGKVKSMNCLLCVQSGRCDPLDPDPRFCGTLIHRVLTCPSTEDFRAKHAPPWIRSMSNRVKGNPSSITKAELALVTRALAPTPAVSQQDPEASFEWIKDPGSRDLGPCTFYADGSRLFAEHKYFGLCARQGWAWCAIDAASQLVAAAQGRPPAWAEGIFGAELWATLMATHASSYHDDQFRVDCQAVASGIRQTSDWGADGKRTLARAWIPVLSAFEGRTDCAAWMPAHCNEKAAGQKYLSNGSPLTILDVSSNGMVDTFAKRVARREAPTQHELWSVRAAARRLTEAARWLGQITALANHFPVNAVDSRGRAVTRHIRDSEGFKKVSQPAKKKEKPPTEDTPLARTPGDLSECPRWAALRQRLLARTSASE